MSAFEEAVANGVSVEDFNKVFIEELGHLIQEIKSKHDVDDSVLRHITLSFEKGINLGMSLVAHSILKQHLVEESDESTKH